MAQMLNGLKKLYTGEKAFERQLSLFSICGIAGLITGYLAIANQGYIEITNIQKICFTILLVIFGLFFIGYETLFMHTRTIPDIGIDSFKIAIKKIPFIIFLVGIPILITSLFTKYQYSAFCIEMFLAIPLTMLQAGFSYNYQNNDYLLLFHKFNVKDIFFLLIKRLWIVVLTYITTYFLIFIIFFIIGLISAFYYKGDINTMSMAISSQQVTIAKLSNYIASILYTYIISIGILVWDYELLKTYEREE